MAAADKKDLSGDELAAALAVVEANVVKILNLDMGPNAINETIMPTFRLVHQISKKDCAEVRETLKTSLTAKIAVHVAEIANRVSGVTDLELLRAYSNEWSRFQVSCYSLDSALKRLFQEVPDRQQPPLRREHSQLRAFCNAQWSEHLLEPLKQRIQPAIFEVLAKQRAGNLDDFQTLRNAIDSYRQIDIKQNLYISEFEQPFLQHTREHYQAEAEKFSTADPKEYLEFCERSLELEDRIAEKYLAPHSYQAHKDRVYRALILGRIDQLREALAASSAEQFTKVREALQTITAE